MRDEKRLREIWWNLHETSRHETLLSIEDSDKKNFLISLYDALYSELRDKDERQQQVVGWGFTILASSGLITLFASEDLPLPGVTVFCISLIAITFALTKTISLLSEERMSIARQLDRIHITMGAFKEDFYCKGTLFDPVWFGWGFDEKRDSNHQLSRIYRAVLWTALPTDLIILSSTFY